MFWYKKLTRGFNQTEIIIKNLNKFFWYIYDFNIIKKIKSTKPQSHFNKNQRLINLKNCYKIDLNLLKTNKNKLFIIIDDLVSSWTTINEISKILKQNWIKKVYWLLLLLINLFFLLFYIII